VRASLTGRDIVITLGRLPEDAWQRMQREREKALRACFDELKSLENKKLTLVKPTFFIPGWTGEDAKTWYDDPRPDEFYKPIEYWLDRIIVNRDFAKRVTLEKESRESSDIFQFGANLKNRLLDQASGMDVNLVGHSMGGLVARAAVYCNEGEPLRVHDFITLGTPNRGAFITKFFYFKPFVDFFEKKVRPLTPQHVSQAQSMAMNSPDIRRLNSPDSWRVINERIDNFLIFMGLKDITVQNSPKLRLEDDVPEDIFKAKFRVYQTSGTVHSGRFSITRDPRVLLPVIQSLCGIQLKENQNHGFMRVS